MKHTGAYFFSSVLLFVSLVVLCIFVTMLVYPYKVAHVKSPAEVVKKEYYAGDALEYRFEAVVFNSYPVVEVRRRLDNGVHYVMESSHPPTPKVGHVDAIITSNIIPKVPPGEYKMVFEAVHQVNFLRPISVFWETEKFIVKE